MTVAVTLHGVTVGVFVPTPRPSSADVQSLREASARLQAVLSMGDEDVNAAVADFDGLHAAAQEGGRASLSVG